jgi:hypothetical protein
LRIIRLACGNDHDAELFRGLDLALSLGARKDFRRAGAAAAGERRQRFQRRARSAEMIDECAEGARSRYYGANATRIFATP